MMLWWFVSDSCNNVPATDPASQSSVKEGNSDDGMKLMSLPKIYMKYIDVYLY